MVKVSEQNEKHIMRDSQLIAKLCIRAGVPKTTDLWSYESLKNWFTRLAFEIAPFAVIVGGFGAHIWITQQTDGVVCKLLIFLSLLLELGLIWIWNRARILNELTS